MFSCKRKICDFEEENDVYQGHLKINHINSKKNNKKRTELDENFKIDSIKDIIFSFNLNKVRSYNLKTKEKKTFICARIASEYYNLDEDEIVNSCKNKSIYNVKK